MDDHRRDNEAVEAAARLPARQTHCGKDEALQLLAAQHRELDRYWWVQTIHNRMTDGNLKTIV
ncbi:hypothetical protein [uncultured Senegalimassilia sp.]|uniref:hypothetical protein n=1 Tax=uncultured Senegalimassilia sp. TaxID=1714350 RepID=UPI0026740836|nr:hypothetical protein [uncultured Senegalimassilia sp.]